MVLYGNAGTFNTFTISADGTTLTEVVSLEHDTGLGSDNSLVQIDADTYALSYTGAELDGFLKTFTVDADGLLPVSLTGFAVD